jgi:membrane protease YdiL (CAAX protease family)
MTPDVLDAAKKLIAPIAVLLVAVVIWRVRALSWRDDVAVVGPKRSDLLPWLAWLGAWAAWMAVAEVVGRKLGMPAPEQWQDRSGASLGILFVGMVLLAPVGEELVFRGILYGRLAGTSLGKVGAVLVCAVVFGLLHVRYGMLLVGFIVIDGIWYGAARATTGSVVVPMAMHVMGNLLAWYQHLPRKPGG